MTRKHAAVATFALCLPLSLLLAGPSEAAGKSVDIILSVGQAAGGDACNGTDAGRCGLARVRIALGSTVATLVDTVVEQTAADESGTGAIEPAISPNGRRLAWIERTGKKSSLWAMDLDQRRPMLIVDFQRGARGGGDAQRPEWPEWLSDSALLFDMKTGDTNGVQNKTLYSIDVMDLTRPGSITARWGSEAGVPSGLQDPAVRTTAAGTEIVAFGPTESGGGPGYTPIVATISPGGVVGTAQTRVSLGKNASGNAIKECHHPAFNVSGDEILCMVHEPSEKVGGQRTKLLYSFKKNTGGDWLNAGRTFSPREISATGMDSESLFTGCNSVVYKYAQWCGDNDYVITNLYCAGEGSGGRGSSIAASRVVLIGRSKQQYVDITSLVEKSKGLSVGDMSGWSATCKASG